MSKRFNLPINLGNFAYKNIFFQNGNHGLTATLFFKFTHKLQLVISSTETIFQEYLKLVKTLVTRFKIHMLGKEVPVHY